MNRIGICREPHGWMLRIGDFTVGFAWTFGGDGASSRRLAYLAHYHPRWSATWRWALYWSRPGWRPFWPRVFVCRKAQANARLALWPIGELTLSWQPTVRMSPP